MTNAVESGAADFVTRPIDIKELYARSLMVLRRSENRRTSIERCTVSNFTLDKEAGTVHYDGHPVKLTSREFSMAWLFFSNPGVYFSRKQIATMIWGSDIDIVERTLEQHIYKLRKKLALCKMITSNCGQYTRSVTSSKSPARSKSFLTRFAKP